MLVDVPVFESWLSHQLVFGVVIFVIFLIMLEVVFAKLMSLSHLVKFARLAQLSKRQVHKGQFIKGETQ